MKLLKELTMASGVSGDEKEIRNILYNNLNNKVDKCYFDGIGSFISKKGDGDVKVALVSHMDEVGFIIKYIDDNGYIFIDPIGSWFNQTMLNQKVIINDFNGNKHLGIIGSIAPHSLTDKMKKEPIEIADMFIDTGYNSKEEVLKSGINIGNFVVPHSEYVEFGNNKIMAKALDNRIGNSLVVDIMESVDNKNIELYGVATVQEEVGLRGAQTSASTIKPDIAIAVDVVVAGDTPLMKEKDFPSKLGSGPSLALFDKRAFPNLKLQRKVEQIAKENNIPFQLYTIKTGATDAGRYNVMEGGCPVVTISIPTRYIHSNNSIIDKKDYEYTKELLEKLIEKINKEFLNEIKDFLN